MANYKVTDTELTALADSVRAKTGGSAPLEWKAGKGFSDAVGGINAYSALDDGKVVSNGALVAQGSQTITENGTYDTTLIGQIIANIEGGEGGTTNLLTGTDAPAASLGSDGDVYLMYNVAPSDVPSDVKVRNYISNSAVGPYINTGYIFKANSKIEMKINIPSALTQYPTPFGCRINTSGSGANQWYLALNSSGTVYYAMGGAERSASSAFIYNVDAIITAKAAQATIEQYAQKNTIDTNAQNTEGTVPLYLFAVNLNGSPWNNSYAAMRLYYCRIYEGDTLVHNYLPALDANDTPCLYDSVAGQYLYNAGSGAFTDGGEIQTTIRSAYCKVSGAWQELIGTDIEDVNVGDSGIELQEKTATANGEVTADNGYNGLSKVTVSVPSPVGRSF